MTSESGYGDLLAAEVDEVVNCETALGRRDAATSNRPSARPVDWLPSRTDAAGTMSRPIPNRQQAARTSSNECSFTRSFISSVTSAASPRSPSASVVRCLPHIDRRRLASRPNQLRCMPGRAGGRWVRSVLNEPQGARLSESPYREGFLSHASRVSRTKAANVRPNAPSQSASRR
jgi:hypothetical protein